MCLFVPSSETVKVYIMKRIITIVMLTAGLLQGFSQEVSADDRSPQRQVADTNDNVRVAIGKDLFILEDTQEATNLRVGDRGIKVLESLEGGSPKVEFEYYGKNETFCEDEEKQESAEKRRKQFRGHWSGIEVGFNNYTFDNKTLTLPADISYMALHSGKSRNLNLNFGQLSIGLARHVGFVTGLGVTWNNYRFDGNNNIQKGTDGRIEMLDPGEPLKKSKLSTFYLRVPLLLEFQIPTDHRRLNLSAGPIGALKLGSYSSMVFENDDKVKSDDDFNLNLLRYGVTARIGYENFNFYGTYYFTPMFKTGLGPAGNDLFPVEIGFAFTIDD